MRSLPFYMIKHLSIFLILFLPALQSHAQKKGFKIQGLWEVHGLLTDTVDPASVQVWYVFDNTKMSALMGPDYAFLNSIETTVRYTLKNDTLKTFYKDKTSVCILLTVLSPNLVSYTIIGDEKQERTYLKRVIKK